MHSLSVQHKTDVNMVCVCVSYLVNCPPPGAAEWRTSRWWMSPVCLSPSESTSAVPLCPSQRWAPSSRSGSCTPSGCCSIPPPPGGATNTKTSWGREYTSPNAAGGWTSEQNQNIWDSDVISTAVFLSSPKSHPRFLIEFLTAFLFCLFWTLYFTMFVSQLFPKQHDMSCVSVTVFLQNIINISNISTKSSCVVPGFP